METIIYKINDINIKYVIRIFFSDTHHQRWFHGFYKANKNSNTFYNVIIFEDQISKYLTKFIY